MEIEQFIKTYIDIEKNTFVRNDKNKKFEALFNNIQATGFNCIDVVYIVRQLGANNVSIRQPLYNQLIFPVLSACVDNDNLDAIKVLISLDQQLFSYQKFTKNYTYSISSLLAKGLRISPDDIELLGISEQTTRDYLNHTLHEIPTGVLYDMNGASIENCKELLKLVDEYEILCNRLQIDRSELIQECRYYYPAYRDYLAVYKNYKNFADYLNIVCQGQK